VQGTPRVRVIDTQLFVAREHGFASWPKFAAHIDQLTRPGSPVANFEAAVDAIVSGDITALASLLRAHPGLARARSTRAHPTLLHYVSANGVEDYRQKTPPNIVEITRLLLDAGADVNATSGAYGGGSTTLGLVGTSVHPEQAGVQIPLLELLLQHGADLEQPGYPVVKGCLANGQGPAARFLASHGAALDFEDAAGVGRLDLVKSYFDGCRVSSRAGRRPGCHDIPRASRAALGRVRTARRGRQATASTWCGCEREGRRRADAAATGASHSGVRAHRG
jgi:hypothetical protein